VAGHPDNIQQGVYVYVTHRLFPAEKIASHLLALDDIFKAFELMKSGDALRVILKP